MQMKQFSLAGISLHTIIKSSQAGIAVSNHKWDLWLKWQELRLGRPLSVHAMPLLCPRCAHAVPTPALGSILHIGTLKFQCPGRAGRAPSGKLCGLVPSRCPSPLTWGEHPDLLLCGKAEAWDGDRELRTSPSSVPGYQ